MALYDLQEQDQLDDLKAWWARWGGTISTGVILAAVLIAGVQGWRWWNANKAEQASALYTAVSESVRKNEPAKARDAITQLEDKYAGTGYAPRAALLYARMLYDAGDKAGAKLQLQWVIDHADEDELKSVGRYRLAQAQIDERQYDQALATLDARHPEAFDGLYADLRGDALAAAGRKEEARTAYQTATAKLDPKSQYLQYVRVKLDALGGPVTEPGATAGAPAKAAVPATTGAATATTGAATAPAGSAAGAASGSATGAPAGSATSPGAPASGAPATKGTAK
jgi:predicted negative regulator of RcsB-dependent stress response